MVNRLRGEISAELDGKSWTLCLTLGALAALETDLKVESLNELTSKFSNGRLSSSDILMIVKAGLMGGGHIISDEDVSHMRVEGGINGYVDIAVRLLEATFSPLKDE